MIKQAYSKIQAQGWLALVRAIKRRVIPIRARCHDQSAQYFVDRIGLELGGPSGMFKVHGLFPVYAVAARIDNLNFGHQTVWEGAISEGLTFRYDPLRAPGDQYVGEASNLKSIQAASYDFVLSSNTLEHIANPLKALGEWIRVLKEGGLLVLALPHRDGTFDHRRPVSTLNHLLEDFQQDVSEADLTHLDEILSLHDLRRDPAAGSHEAFKARAQKNFENRCLHHHVFDTALAVALVDCAGLQLVAVEAFRPYDILIVARKLAPVTAPANAPFQAPDAFRNSPFPSDRRPGV